MKKDVIYRDGDGITNSKRYDVTVAVSLSFTAFLFMVVNFILTTASLAMVHERVPDRNTYGPLPDIVLDNVTAQDWALNVSEVLIMIMSNSAMIFIIFHKHRYVRGTLRQL